MPKRRSPASGVLGGVATAAARQSGVDATLIRVGLVVLCLLSGIGAAAYVAAWLLIPEEGGEESIASRALHDGRGLVLVGAFVPLLVVLDLLAGQLHASFVEAALWSAFICSGGAVIVWRNGGAADKQRLREALQAAARLGIGGSRRSWASLVARVAIGFALAALGVAAMTVEHRSALYHPLAGVGAIAAAVIMVFGPWWLDLARQLALERQARLRAEERAEMASRVHDSVLQTLALIQRNAGDPGRVAQLARAQERELRSWLFGGRPPASAGAEATSLSEAVSVMQGEVEAAHGVRVECVVVGDALLSAPVEALLAAGREAVVNAAKWSGAGVISVFVEAEEREVAMYVRDRGRGFDRSAVGTDRRGLSESIEGRMARAGGSAEVRSVPGEGTEVVVRVSRPAGHERPPAAAPR